MYKSSIFQYVIKTSNNITLKLGAARYDLSKRCTVLRFPLLLLYRRYESSLKPKILVVFILWRLFKRSKIGQRINFYELLLIVAGRSYYKLVQKMLQFGASDFIANSLLQLISNKRFCEFITNRDSHYKSKIKDWWKD